MKAISLKKAVEARGGQAQIITKTVTDFSGEQREITYLEGELNGYDIHMIGSACSFFTVRRISNRGAFDPGSDYNPGGYDFCNRLIELDWACGIKKLTLA